VFKDAKSIMLHHLLHVSAKKWLVNVLVREADVEVTDLVDVVKDWEDV